MAIIHEYTYDLVCPYCGHEHYDDGEMNEAGQAECVKCEKHFKYDVNYTKFFTSKQVPCLNGVPHEEWKYEWSPTKDAFRCIHCDCWRYQDKEKK